MGNFPPDSYQLPEAHSHINRKDFLPGLESEPECEPVQVLEDLPAGHSLGSGLGQPVLDASDGVGLEGATPRDELQPREAAHLLYVALPGQDQDLKRIQNNH